MDGHDRGTTSPSKYFSKRYQDVYASTGQYYTISLVDRSSINYEFAEKIAAYIKENFQGIWYAEYSTKGIYVWIQESADAAVLKLTYQNYLYQVNTPFAKQKPSLEIEKNIKSE